MIHGCKRKYKNDTRIDERMAQGLAHYCRRIVIPIHFIVARIHTARSCPCSGGSIRSVQHMRNAIGLHHAQFSIGMQLCLFHAERIYDRRSTQTVSSHDSFSSTGPERRLNTCWRIWRRSSNPSSRPEIHRDIMTSPHPCRARNMIPRHSLLTEMNNSRTLMRVMVQTS